MQPYGVDNFDPTIRPTHDHINLKVDLPEHLRWQRKLTKIENGCVKGFQGQLALPFNAYYNSVLGIHQINGLPYVYIPKKEDVVGLSTRLFSLGNSQIGAAFLHRLASLKAAIFLSLFHSGKRVQVVVDIYKDGPPPYIDSNRLPLEWVLKTDRDNCDRFLSQIFAGVTCIQIDSTHPQKKAIFTALSEISMRSVGVKFLLVLMKINKLITIRYAPNRNEMVLSYERGVEVFIDFSYSVAFASIQKGTGKIVPLARKAIYILWHELIHAHNKLKQILYKEEGWVQHLLAHTQYNRFQRRYEYVGPYRFYGFYTNLEEQSVICGGGGVRSDFSENQLRYAFFEDLRWSHLDCSTLFSLDIMEAKFFTGDLCREAQLSRVALMILKCDIRWSSLILEEASMQEIEDGVRRAEEFWLPPSQAAMKEAVKINFFARLYNCPGYASSL